MESIIFRVCFLFLLVNNVYAKGVLSYQQFGRLNTPAQSNVKNGFFEFSLLSEGKKNKRENYVEATFRMYPGGNAPMYALPEAYISHRSGKTLLTFGRKIVDWAPNEKYWVLGKTNGVRGFNLLEQKQEGLMGFHFERSSGKIHMNFIASYVHIPQVNPTFKIRNGVVESPNEWSKHPPRYARYNGATVPIYYSLDTPDYGKILVQPTIGGELAYGDKKSLVSAYYAYKPEPNISINATGYYEQEQEERAFVRAKPFANHHHVYGLSYVRNFENGLYSKTAYDVADPKNGSDDSFKFESLKIVPNFYKESYATTSVGYQNDYGRVGLNFLEKVEGEISEDDILGKKPKWNRAVGLDVDYQLSHNWNFFADLKFDIKYKDIIIKSELAYRLSKHVGLMAGVELLESPNAASYWASFRSNDSVYSNLSYSF